MGLLSEFREFAVKGNVVDLAVGVIIGAAFNGIVKSLVDQVVMPPIGLITGGIDFSELEWVLRPENPATAEESAANVGIEITDGRVRLAYVPGAAAVPPALRERLSRANAILFDGTLFTDDEMIRAGLGEKTGRRMGHMPVDGPDGSIAALNGLPARRILIHINNTNPILVDGSPQRLRVEAAGWEVAWDGMEIVL